MADQPTDPAQQLMNLMKAGQEAWLEAAHASTAGRQTDPHEDPFANFASMTRLFVELQQSYLTQVNATWLNFFGVSTPPPAPAEDDRRFAGEAWKSDPRFAALTRTYLAYSACLHGLAEAAPVDEKSKGQLRHTVRQFTDAMSPSNFLATNPEALKLATSWTSTRR